MNPTKCDDLLRSRAQAAAGMGYWNWIYYLRNQQMHVESKAEHGDRAGIWRSGVVNEIRRIESSFPRDPTEFLPTRLGNVLRRYERIAGEPFALDALTAVPQLALVAPDKDVAYLNGQRSALDLAVRLSMTSLLATALAVAYLWNDGLWLQTRERTGASLSLPSLLPTPAAAAPADPPESERVQARPRWGVFPTGEHNAITDVPEVSLGGGKWARTGCAGEGDLVGCGTRVECLSAQERGRHINPRRSGDPAGVAPRP